jgi:hypothetical protein
MGLLAIVLGLAFYQSCRPPISIHYFINQVFIPNFTACDTAISGQLPMLCHQFGMVFVSTSVDNKLNFTKWAVIWFLINSSLELGQLRTEEINWLPSQLESYLVQGTFDSLDILAAASVTVSIIIIDKYFALKGYKNENK